MDEVEKQEMQECRSENFIYQFGDTGLSGAV
jgi:hypothetical protein